MLKPQLLNLLAVIKNILSNQEVIKEQTGMLVKLVYELKRTAEESPSLPLETLPIATLQDLQILESQLQDQEFKKTGNAYLYNILLSNYTMAHPVSLSKTYCLFLLKIQDINIL